MTATEDLEVKLSILRHVIDTKYWKMPAGSPIVPHPDLTNLQDAPIGSRLGDPTGRSSWTGGSAVKTGPDAWRVHGLEAGGIRQYSSDQLAKSLGSDLAKTKLAVPKGAVSRGQFRDLFGKARQPRTAYESKLFTARKGREAKRAAYEAAHPELGRQMAAFEQQQRMARIAREQALQAATTQSVIGGTSRALARAV